jgi:hypothetical protein
LFIGLSSAVIRKENNSVLLRFLVEGYKLLISQRSISHVEILEIAVKNGLRPQLHECYFLKGKNHKDYLLSS